MTYQERLYVKWPILSRIVVIPLHAGDRSVVVHYLLPLHRNQDRFVHHRGRELRMDKRLRRSFVLGDR